MPKGSLLHCHNTALTSSEWVVKNITYRPNLLRCINNKGVPIFTFRRNAVTDCTHYVSVDEERSRTANKEEYDKMLEETINLYTPIPENHYTDINIVWNKFQKMFDTVGDMLRYLPAYRDYHYRALQELYEDGIIYVEMRTSFPTLYDEMRTYSSLEAVNQLKNIVEDFKKQHANFLGVKIIYSTSRNASPIAIRDKVKTFRQLNANHPQFVIGFDIVGQEDLGRPLYDFASQLKSLPQGAYYFFHAGETNWYGITDTNILDAILLNTTRIGHGYALMKHPVLWNAVKRKGIAVEISPISNQILHLVWDMRNHPASFLLSENIPIIIANDDPGFWNAKGLSYDFYYSFMSFAPIGAGLKTLKQLIWNSLKYSTFTNTEKAHAADIFQKMWNKFLDDILSGNPL